MTSDHHPLQGIREFGDVEFRRQGGLCRLVMPGNGLTFASSASTPGSGIAGVDAFGVQGVPSPAGARLHRMRLRFRSRGLFDHEPAAHLALGLTGDWQKSDPGIATPTGRVVGRGAIIGNVSGAPFGCQRWPVVQLESFHRNGNRLVEDSGSAALVDGCWYVLDLSATIDGDIAYQLRDDAGTLLGEAECDDRAADVSTGLGGWWITHVFSDHHTGRDWSFDIANLQVGWE